MQNTFGRRGPAALAGLVVALSLVGCGSSPDDFPRESVSGTVTLDGQPLEKGTIEFSPTDLNAGTPSGGEVVDGSFSIPRDLGPPPGSYVVRVNAVEELPPNPKADPNALDTRIPKNLVPARFNTKSTLTAEVKKGESNAFEFAVQSK